METHIHTHTDIQTEKILRNHAHAWFNNDKDLQGTEFSSIP